MDGGAYGGGERCAQGSSGETRGKEAIGETQTQMGGQYYGESSGSGRGWRLDGVGSGYGQVAGTCECGNEPSGSVK